VENKRVQKQEISFGN
jgi:hypothetical protein